MPHAEKGRGVRAVLVGLGATILTVALVTLPPVRLGPYALHRPGLASSCEDGSSKQAGLHLCRYVADLQAVPLDRISGDLSGLTYSGATGTLFGVVNRPAAVVELTTEGRTLRRIPLRGVADPEDISHLAGDAFLIVSERDSTLVPARIGPDTRELDLHAAARMRVPVAPWNNLGLEGLSYDPADHRIIVAQEALPLRILEIRSAGPDRHGPAHIAHWLPANDPALFMRDISAVSLHQPTQHTLVLSDRSRMLVEYTPDGKPLSVLSLRRGSAGLRRDVPQAEGVAVGPDGALFVVSEPNLFYRFRPPD